MYYFSAQTGSHHEIKTLQCNSTGLPYHNGPIVQEKKRKSYR